MRTKLTIPRSRDFYHAPLDTLLRVEENDGQVVVRATSNRFTPERQRAFVRWLADEGFISEAHHWSTLGVRWVKDLSWARLDPALAARTNRAMYRIFAGAAACGVLLMADIFLRH